MNNKNLLSRVQIPAFYNQRKMNKKYRDFGAVDFDDHQIEQLEKQYEKDRKEIEGDKKDEK